MDPVAVYGAILATLTASWQVYREVKDRKPGVRITVGLGSRCIQGVAFVGNACFGVTVVNTGKAPVTITSFGLNVGEDDIPIVDAPVPTDLTEGQTVTAGLDIKHLRGKCIYYGWAVDSLGRRYESAKVTHSVDQVLLVRGAF